MPMYKDSQQSTIYIYSYSTAIFRGCFKSHWHGDRLKLRTWLVSRVLRVNVGVLRSIAFVIHLLNTPLGDRLKLQINLTSPA
ncbi:hypothetical protein [Cylindrospermopsis raciborskii]|uniref:hypothetical protein n=1 Tax=Cylindrospermopsis raciborskii TaxID=77022 RepID=UPI0011AEC88E|nr:hypothetical protein [Cylindrospermopsis raciborskii]